MIERTSLRRAAVRPHVWALLVPSLLVCTTQLASAVSCNVVRHGPQSEADKALLSSDFVKAESLYRADVAGSPANPAYKAGLVHALLRQAKLADAAQLVEDALAVAPDSSDLLTLRGEVEYRQGLPWKAADTANEVTQLDPCNPRNMLLLSRIARLNSLFATAARQIAAAHRLDPEDPEITSRWLASQTVPGTETHKECHLVSAFTSTQVPFIKMMRDANRVSSYGLAVKLNRQNARLEIDTGATGLLISRSVAERAGLKPYQTTELGGIGADGSQIGYTTYADFLHIGNMEFQDCLVRVIDSSMPSRDIDGLIGMDVFSQFLVTIDYPMHKVLLSPLPPRPGDAGTSSSLNTKGSGINLGQVAANSPHDRYVAPEMKDYTEVYRVGQDLIVPASVNGSPKKLFIVDTGSWSTTIAPELARQFTTVRDSSSLGVQGISGRVNKVYTADAITFNFAHLSQTVEDVASFDTSSISNFTGLQISGFLGANTLRVLAIHIDYRDGLVKFDQDPARRHRN